MPANSKILNLDALEAEATGAPFPFVFGGVTYTMSGNPDVRAVAKLEQNDLIGFLQAMLGQEQFDRLWAAPEVLGKNELRALIDGYFEHIGTDAGESSASRKPSGRTVTPSKRTSRGTTGSRSRSSLQVS